MRTPRKYHLTKATADHVRTTGKERAGSESAFVEALVRLEATEPNPRLVEIIAQVRQELDDGCSTRGTNNVDAALEARGRSRRPKHQAKTPRKARESKALKK